MKAYVAEAGFRSMGGPGHVKVEQLVDTDPPGPATVVSSTTLRQHTRHSPDGHAWGYGGSGPAQLALDVLWDLLGQEPHPRLYQEFKFNVIAALPQDQGFVLTEQQIREWLAKHESLPWTAD